MSPRTGMWGRPQAHPGLLGSNPADYVPAQGWRSWPVPPHVLSRRCGASWLSPPSARHASGCWFRPPRLGSPTSEVQPLENPEGAVPGPRRWDGSLCGAGGAWKPVALSRFPGECGWRWQGRGQGRGGRATRPGLPASWTGAGQHQLCLCRGSHPAYSPVSPLPQHPRASPPASPPGAPALPEAGRGDGRAEESALPPPPPFPPRAFPSSSPCLPLSPLNRPELCPVSFSVSPPRGRSWRCSRGEGDGSCPPCHALSAGRPWSALRGPFMVPAVRGGEMHI